MIPTRIVGSHCESGDILVNDALVPDDVQAGDLVMLGLRVPIVFYGIALQHDDSSASDCGL